MADGNIVGVKLEALAALTEVQFRYNQRAVELQAREYERRLTLLNGEAARLREIQLNYLPREVYEAHQADMEKSIDALKEFRATSQGRQAVMTIGVSFASSLVVSLTAVLITHFFKF